VREKAKKRGREREDEKESEWGGGERGGFGRQRERRKIKLCRALSAQRGRCRGRKQTQIVPKSPVSPPKKP